MDNILLSAAINLTMFGMGFVFIFLALMVVVTNLMSMIFLKLYPTINVTPSINPDSSVEIDEKTRAIIEAAIKMHTQR